jgi:hypothetical protein
VPLQPLIDTNERMHAIVRLRMGLPMKGLEDKGDYDPESMEGWTATGLGGVKNEPNDAATENAAVPRQGGVAGITALKEIQDGPQKIIRNKESKGMREEPMSLFEWELLTSFVPSIGGQFLAIAPK